MCAEFLTALLVSGWRMKIRITDLYKQFIKRVDNNWEHNTNIQTLTEFGLLLANAKDASEGYGIGQEIGDKNYFHDMEY
jgi:hypothetical protein